MFNLEKMSVLLLLFLLTENGLLRPLLPVESHVNIKTASEKKHKKEETQIKFQNLP